MQEFTEEGIKSRLVYLIGKRNISIDTASSDEFYQLITYCIAYGITIQNRNKDNILSVAQKAFKQCKEYSLHKTLLKVAQDMKTQMINEFSKHIYCSVSIDGGTAGGQKNLDFNLENPLGSVKPFTIYTEIMEGLTSEHYVQYLLNGLSYIHKQNIHIDCVICDGNTAQKKCFSFSWPQSLRHLRDYPYLSKIIFVPCLCHRSIIRKNYFRTKIDIFSKKKDIINTNA